MLSRIGRGQFYLSPTGSSRRRYPHKSIRRLHRDNQLAQNNKLGIKHMEALILVSGCTLVTSWAAAAFVDTLWTRKFLWRAER